MMDQCQLDDVADELLGRARAASSGRAARTIFGGSGHLLRQTVMAILAGQQLTVHNNPGDATLQVLRGEVSLAGQTRLTTASAGGFVVIPDERHSLTALDDSVVVLTVVVR